MEEDAPSLYSYYYSHYSYYYYLSHGAVDDAVSYSTRVPTRGWGVVVGVGKRPPPPLLHQKKEGED